MKTDKFTETISDRLYLLRTEVLGLTQQAFAESLSIRYPHTISSYENGHVRPSLKTCMRMLRLAQDAGHAEITLEYLRPDLMEDDDE